MRWLACYDSQSGMAQLSNVGIVEAETRADAIRKAQSLFRTTAAVDVYPIDELSAGWSYWR